MFDSGDTAPAPPDTRADGETQPDAASPTVWVDVLPAATEKTAIRWVRGGAGKGLLYIDTRKGTACYWVEEFPTPWDGRAFKLGCYGGQSDKDATSYQVFVGRNGQDNQCECKGFSYGRGKPCRHILACVALWDNGWLDMGNPDADTGPTETADQRPPF